MSIIGLNAVGWEGRYRAHMSSARWRNTRTDMIRLRGSRCEGCKVEYPASQLEVHHKTYERMGAERIGDLMVLCPPCHRTEDALRAQQGRERSRLARARAQRQAALETYALKVYGDHEVDVEEEFDEWLDGGS